MEIHDSLLLATSNISACFTLIPLFFAFIFFKNIYTNAFYIFILVFVSALVEGLNSFYSLFGENNFFIFHFYTIIEFCLISLFYRNFFKNYIQAKVFYFFIVLFLVFAFTDYKLNGLDSIDNLAISVESIILTLYSLYLYYFVLKNLVFDKLLDAPVFWINSGILIYFMGNLMLFVFSNYLLVGDPTIHNKLWSLIHSFFNVIYNTLIVIGFWKARVR